MSDRVPGAAPAMGAAHTDDGSPGVVSQEGDESASRDLGEMQRAARIAGPPG